MLDHSLTQWVGLSLTLALAACVAESQGSAIDYSVWERYREGVKHPCAAVKPQDLERARRNIERYEWARTYAEGLQRDADGLVEAKNAAWLETFIERTTPGCVGPCPACRAQGLPWHPNGQWSWSASTPNQLTCQVCKTVFPNDRFPESVVVRSTWDPEQEFSFIGGDTFRCFGYTQARPSLSGIIRARKIGHAIGSLHRIALAYALTGDPRYAQTAKTILLRFAEVLPKYLVRAGYGYGEYADCDPHIAAERILDLPNDELVYPPNQPDRKIYTGYWSASRLGSSGMDGGMVGQLAQAYDLTCTAEDVYSPEDRRRIERDVLLEAAFLAVCDPDINNKSVGNRCGAAMVGMVTGQPDLVRFGLDGFRRAVEEWFLPDGGSSESPAYALMTMSGIAGFGLMFRDYSDPVGYLGPDDKRLDGFNACRDTRYGDCWQSLIWTLQGNLRHPPSADSYRTTSIGAPFAELIAVGYPSDEHLALLKELAGPDLGAGSAEQALLYREPGLEARDTPPFALPDVVFPFLAQGYLRTGATGRDSLALLNASDWGNHHHLDSLDLYYWKDSRELLSDLGYLWDHPDSYQTRRTLAHNLVLIDGTDQRGAGRGGSFHLFSLTPRVKVMEASSRAYANAEVYRRTCVQIDHGEAGSYLLDIFRVKGGRERQYVFHGPGPEFQLEGLSPDTAAAAERRAPFAVRLHCAEVGELYVDDAEVRPLLADGSEGPNLVANSSLAVGEVANAPPGWGLYSGDGKADCGVFEPGHEDLRCVRFRALAPHENGRMNAALMIGASDGYTGQDALPGVLGVTYRVRFWLRGNASKVTVGVVTWPNDPRSPADRTHLNMLTLTPTEKWTAYQAEVTLPSNALPLTNIRQAPGGEPWRITWPFPDDYEFTALSPGHEGETVVIGDGWGQRDHRNTDRGATLPYVVRSRQGTGLDAFISVFAGAPTGRLPVTGVRLLDLPATVPEDAVAVEVTTPAGADVVVSMLTPQLLTLKTSCGTLTTDGALATVLGSGTAPRAACLIGGTRLEVGAAKLRSDRASVQGQVESVDSAPGESWFVLDATLPDGCAGQTLFVEDAKERRAYPIRAVSGPKVYTKLGNVGVEARRAERWEFPLTLAWETH